MTASQETDWLRQTAAAEVIGRGLRAALQQILRERMLGAFNLVLLRDSQAGV